MTFDPAFLLPDATTLRLETVDYQPGTAFSLTVSTNHTSAACPLCHETTTRIHSRYTRTLADLPWADQSVRLQLRTRKFICTNTSCPRRIFTERLPTVVAPWARRTVRLATAQRQLSLTAGGRGAERVSHSLAMSVSDDTLLTLARQTPLPPQPTPQVVGVDDWALRKGQTYATILVDLQTGEPIDLLSERSAAQFAQWLREHPSITVISRDRGEIYAEGATTGAPDAIQVADRWHILKNLGDALLRVLQQHHHALAEALSTPDTPLASLQDVPTASMDHTTVAVSDMSEASPPRVLTRREQEQQLRHAAKRARQEQVQQLHGKGWSLHAIAAHTGLERKTVRKYVQLPTLPPPQARGQRSSVLDPYKPFVLERWQAGRNAMEILDEIRAQGYSGQRSTLRAYLTQVRKTHGLPPRSRSDTTRANLLPTRKPPTLRTLTWLILRGAETLTAEEQGDVMRARQAHTDVARAIDLAQDFADMVRNRHADALDAWLARATASTLVPLRNFAKSLQKDEAAIRAALTLEWSNGPVEGHINRLKLLKRQAYGRAKLDLLRARLLAA